MTKTAAPPKHAHAEQRRILPRGTLLGKIYEVGDVLGAGGLGQVYEANDLALKRKVAIKVLFDIEGAPPLRNEAQALAAIRHPCAVTVHHLGEHDGRDYLVMERIFGPTLEARLAERSAAGDLLAMEEIVDVLIGITDGLRAAHAAGISHRDVKPSNIMLAAGKRVVLLDFGLVLPEYTTTKLVNGSPDYMAPEVINGSVPPGGGRLVDLYALGIVAYEMLAGAAPFRGGALKQTLLAHVEETPAAVSLARPDVPPKLGELVASLLEKGPDERPQSAEDVLLVLSEAQRRGFARPPKEPKEEKVLVVEDDPNIRQTLAVLVKNAVPTATVRSVAAAEDAVALLDRWMPTILVTDVVLPRMSGIELATYVRGLPGGTECAVVCVSAKTSARDVEFLKSNGIARFVRKGARLGADLAQALHELRATPGDGAPGPLKAERMTAPSVGRER